MRFFFLLTFTITFFIFEVQSSDNVGKVKDFGNLKFPNSRIAYINPSKGAIYEINQEGQITWSYAIPQQVIGSGKLRKGADIEWIKKPIVFCSLCLVQVSLKLTAEKK